MSGGGGSKRASGDRSPLTVSGEGTDLDVHPLSPHHHSHSGHDQALVDPYGYLRTDAGGDGEHDARDRAVDVASSFVLPPYEGPGDTIPDKDTHLVSGNVLPITTIDDGDDGPGVDMDSARPAPMDAGLGIGPRSAPIEQSDHGSARLSLDHSTHQHPGPTMSTRDGHGIGIGEGEGRDSVVRGDNDVDSDDDAWSAYIRHQDDQTGSYLDMPDDDDDDNLSEGSKGEIYPTASTAHVEQPRPTDHSDMVAAVVSAPPHPSLHGRLRAHAGVTAGPPGPHRCRWADCEFGGHSETELVQHIQTVHIPRKRKIFRAGHEGKQVISEERMVCLWRSDNTGPCHRSYKARADLVHHVKVSHCNIKPFVCQHRGCSQSFGKKKLLERHAVVHTGKKAFVCPDCDATFSQKNGLVKHRVKHQPEESFKHSCPLCQKRFPREEGLQTHIERFHMSQRKQLPCPVPDCFNTYSTRKQLQRHMKLHKEWKGEIPPASELQRHAAAGKDASPHSQGAHPPAAGYSAADLAAYHEQARRHYELYAQQQQQQQQSFPMQHHLQHPGVAAPGSGMWYHASGMNTRDIAPQPSGQIVSGRDKNFLNQKPVFAPLDSSFTDMSKPMTARERDHYTSQFQAQANPSPDIARAIWQQAQEQHHRQQQELAWQLYYQQQAWAQYHGRPAPRDGFPDATATEPTSSPGHGARVTDDRQPEHRPAATMPARAMSNPHQPQLAPTSTHPSASAVTAMDSEPAPADVVPAAAAITTALAPPGHHEEMTPPEYAALHAALHETEDGLSRAEYAQALDMQRQQAQHVDGASTDHQEMEGVFDDLPNVPGLAGRDLMDLQ